MLQERLNFNFSIVWVTALEKKMVKMTRVRSSPTPEFSQTHQRLYMVKMEAAISGAIYHSGIWTFARNRDISFVVFRDHQRKYLPGHFGTGDMPQIPEPSSESIHPVTTDLKIALTVLLYESPVFLDIQNRYDSTGEILAPCLSISQPRESARLRREARQSCQSTLGSLADVRRGEVWL